MDLRREQGRAHVAFEAWPRASIMSFLVLPGYDRVRTVEIGTTHEEFGLMLGVRQSSVIDAPYEL